MIWNVFLILAVLVLVIPTSFLVISKKLKFKKAVMFDFVKVLFVSVVLSATLLFIPIYFTEFKGVCGPVEAVIMSAHNMIRLFILDGDFVIVQDNIGVIAHPIVAVVYPVLMAFLFLAAPLLTFSFVLSFFMNASSFVSYILHYNSDVYVFSKLNEKSFTLAQSLYDSKKNKRLFFVFTDYDKNDSVNNEFRFLVKSIGGVCFESNISNTSLKFHSKNRNVSFFMMSSDYSENNTQALQIINKYKYRDNTNLYVFSVLEETELLLLKAYESEKNNNSKTENKTAKIKVRRIDETYSLVINTLYKNGYEDIFKSAYKQENNKNKKISAVVVGIGEYGTNMLKTLPWFCQMDGYDVEINAFDIDVDAEEKFTSSCPELMSEKHNGNFTDDGEAMYRIKIHSGVDVYTSTFDTLVSKNIHPTYVFVALGDNEKNIAISVKLRTLFEKQGYKPVIKAIVTDTDKCNALSDIRNFKNQRYNIEFIGDIASSYSEEVIINSTLEEKAMNRHKKWGDESSFWKYDYNYYSSLASVVHKEMKIKCKIPDIELAPEERVNKENIEAIRKLEHRRWNAYMRSIGYEYSGDSDSPTTRNDLAKLHHLLVPFDKLILEEQIKDDD